MLLHLINYNLKQIQYLIFQFSLNLDSAMTLGAANRVLLGENCIERRS